MPTVEAAPKQDDISLQLATGRTSKNEVTRAAAVATKGRWIDKQKQVQAPDGTPIMIDITMLLDEEVPIDSLATCNGTTGRVVSWSKVKDIKGVETKKEYYLSRK